MTDESWKDRILGSADAVLVDRGDRKRPHRDYRVRMHLSAVPAVLRAASARGMSVSAYARRAVLAFAAHDLDLDLPQLLADEPPTRRKYDGPAADRAEGGEGHGQWRIEGLG